MVSGHYIGSLNTMQLVMDLWTSYREACGVRTVYSAIGHRIACSGPLDFIWGLGYHIVARTAY